MTTHRHLSASHAVYRRVSAQVTALWALAELGITAWEAWHLARVSGSEFVVARSVVAWVVSEERSAEPSTASFVEALKELGPN